MSEIPKYNPELDEDNETEESAKVEPFNNPENGKTESKYSYGSLEDLVSESLGENSEWSTDSTALETGKLISVKKGEREWIFTDENGTEKSLTKSVKDKDGEERHLLILNELYEQGFSIQEYFNQYTNSMVKEFYFADQNGKVSFQTFKQNEKVLAEYKDNEYDFGDDDSPALIKSSKVEKLTTPTEVENSVEKEFKKATAWETFWNDLLKSKPVKETTSEPEKDLFDIFGFKTESSVYPILSSDLIEETKSTQVSKSDQKDQKATFLRLPSDGEPLTKEESSQDSSTTNTSESGIRLSGQEGIKDDLKYANINNEPSQIPLKTEVVLDQLKIEEGEGSDDDQIYTPKNKTLVTLNPIGQVDREIIAEAIITEEPAISISNDFKPTEPVQINSRPQTIFRAPKVGIVRINSTNEVLERPKLAAEPKNSTSNRERSVQRQEIISAIEDNSSKKEIEIAEISLEQTSNVLIKAVVPTKAKSKSLNKGNESKTVSIETAVNDQKDLTNPSIYRASIKQKRQKAPETGIQVDKEANKQEDKDIGILGYKEINIATHSYVAEATGLQNNTEEDTYSEPEDSSGSELTDLQIDRQPILKDLETPAQTYERAARAILDMPETKPQVAIKQATPKVVTINKPKTQTVKAVAQKSITQLRREATVLREIAFKKSEADRETIRTEPQEGRSQITELASKPRDIELPSQNFRVSTKSNDKILPARDSNIIKSKLDLSSKQKEQTTIKPQPVLRQTSIRQTARTYESKTGISSLVSIVSEYRNGKNSRIQVSNLANKQISNKAIKHGAEDFNRQATTSVYQSGQNQDNEIELISNSASGIRLAA